MLWFKTAILFLPDNYHAYVYVAGILYKNKQVDKAAEIYSAMIPLLPEEGKGLGYYQRSVCFHEMGKLEEEEQDLKQALSLLPSLTQAQFNLATIYMTTNRQEQAKPMFMETAEQLPEGKKARALLNIGVILMRMGQNDQAIIYFKQAVEDEPNYASAYFNWGMALANNADTLDEALEKLEKANELEPANPITKYFIGVLLYHLGRKQEAFAWCRDKMLGQEADEHTIIAFLAQSEKIEQQ
jgi:superkiller protein 3